MTKVKFIDSENGLCGFDISGHSTDSSEDEEGRLVCASVSSAVYLVANTVTEIIGDIPDVLTVNDGEMKLHLNNPSTETVMLLKGLKLHLEELSKDYGNNIRIYGGASHVKD